MSRCIDCIHCGSCDGPCGGRYFDLAVVPCAECGRDVDREWDDCIIIGGRHYHAECAPTKGEDNE